MDDEIDELYEQIQRELLTYMMADPSTITPAPRSCSRSPATWSAAATTSRT
jgi:phosphate uptake regulator